jgi:glyoxylase I family protein
VFLRHEGPQARLGRTQHRPGSQQPFDETRPGLNHLAFAVADPAELDTWVTRPRDAQVVHSPVMAANFVPGAAVVVFPRDPDNIQQECSLSHCRRTRAIAGGAMK